VLLVEDDAQVAQALGEALAEFGYAVDWAASAAEAFAPFDAGAPDAVILGLQLPDADGLILCGDLKARADVPVLARSALPPHPNAVQSLRLGADDFIAKPCRVDELEARPAAALRRRRDARAGVDQERPVPVARAGGVTRAQP
jgi:DNA-binding response OmpR family regulator